MGKTGVKGIARWSDDVVTSVPGAAKEGDRVGVSFLSPFIVCSAVSGSTRSVPGGVLG